MSKLLEKFCKEHPEMIGKMGWWNEDEVGYWVDLAYPYSIDGCSSVHEWTVKDTINQLRHGVFKLPREEYLEIHGWAPDQAEAKV